MPNTSQTSPPRLKRRAPWIALALLAVVGISLAAFAAHRSRRHLIRAAPAPAWDQSESPEEARLLQRALARPRDRGTQALLGRHYLAEERPFEALWALQRAREADARGQDPAILLAMADALERVNLRTRALELLTEAAPQYPGHPALALRQAELQLRLGRPDAALMTLQALSTPPPTPTPTPTPTRNLIEHEHGQNPGFSADLLRGRILEATGDTTAALEAYRRCVASLPSKSKSRSKSTSWSDLTLTPTLTLTRPEGFAEAFLRLGRLLVRLGQVAEGRAALQTAHHLNSLGPEPAYWLGMSYLPVMAENPAPARVWFTEAVKARPGHGPAHVAMGQMCVRHRYWKVAAQEFTQALQADPWDPDALLGLAEVLRALGHQAEAHRRRGMAYVAQGKLPQALAEFRALKAAQPENPKASVLISQTLIQMMLNAEAAKELREAVAHHPRDWDLKERLAQLALITHTPDLVQRLCQEWLRAQPDAPKPLWLLGRAALVAPDLPQAIQYFERAARLAPQDAEIQFALGEALARPGPRHDPGRALELLARAVQLAPREARYSYQLGLLLQQLDRLEPARRQFLRALDRDPTMTVAFLGLMQISSRLQEPGQSALFAPVIQDQQENAGAEARLRRRIYRSPADPSGYRGLARYLADRGDLKGARAQWEVIAALKPDDAAARQALARLNRILDVW